MSTTAPPPREPTHTFAAALTDTTVRRGWGRRGAQTAARQGQAESTVDLIEKRFVVSETDPNQLMNDPPAAETKDPRTS
jgi:hypothetical protein